MIQEIIKGINLNIKEKGLFQDIFELTEQVTQILPYQGDNVSQTFPAVYKKGGELISVFNPDKNRSICWHRSTGNVTISNSEDSVSGCGKTFIYLYQLAVIGIALRNKMCDDSYTDYSVANNLVASLKKIKVAGFTSVDVFPNTIITDKNQVFSDNFTNIEMPVGFEYSLVQVNYNVSIEVNQKCIETYCK